MPFRIFVLDVMLYRFQMYVLYFQDVIYNNILLVLEILLDNMDYGLNHVWEVGLWYCWIIIKVVDYTVNLDRQVFP